MEPVKIHPPEGYEVCPISTQTEIRFRPISKRKPKWENFGAHVGFYVNNISEVHRYTAIEESCDRNRNTWPTKEEAEACLALSQLCQWRDKYNENWRPDWKDNREHKWCIGACNNKIHSYRTSDSNSVLSFKTAKIRDKFLEDFEPLIEIAKPLL